MFKYQKIIMRHTKRYCVHSQNRKKLRRV